jgi:GNAT superfamily N-acetyltransferase
MLRYEWRGRFTNEGANTLHAGCFGHEPRQDDWWGRVNKHSLGWVCAWAGEELVGFVNVAWDGGAHASILDTMVVARLRRRGVGKTLVKAAAEKAAAHRCEWLHVDFEGRLRPFYFVGCGFTDTSAGLLRLKKAPEGTTL